MEEAQTKKNSKKNKEPTTCSGWGSWTGKGADAPPPPNKRLPKRLQAPVKKPKIEAPKKERKPNVIINDLPIKKHAELQVKNVPYPYRSRAEYEAAMAGAIGKEWNVSQTVKDMTRPEVQFTKGRIIRPLSKGAKSKQQRAPAKF
jgi:U3 small nucleolar RNA-associated protein 14